MSKITRKQVVNEVVQLLRQAEIELPEDVLSALKSALKTESNQIARTQLRQMIENAELAKEHGTPMCQDTGTPVFFVDVGYDAEIDFDLVEAIQEGVAKATKEIPLRHNAVHPITREGSENELMDVNLSLVKGNKVKITVAPKGSGSENMSALRMFNPSEVKNIKRFVLETVKNAGGRSCPPIIVGVGIGGTFDGAAKLAKKAVLRKLDKPMDTFERELLDEINSLGLGPMGLGGSTTAMAVNVEYGRCHTASLPVAVNIQCWAARRASITLED
ncbi:MAG: fumarate hydratase [Methanocellales archaeon]|nr:fumarate hydratase [Methanocellales archaeon]MDD3421790.1 fumarate hydratase [Methanocellales archaeon]MDD4897888.1 fumarate hydratase [Methanocellales archaeon]MDD5446453.1 fumarate hydratase [Methanocellales archaeon]